jgi:hypothetical protein
MSPCLLESLSPCFLVSWSPLSLSPLSTDQLTTLTLLVAALIDSRQLVRRVAWGKEKHLGLVWRRGTDSIWGPRRARGGWLARLNA